MESGRDIHLTGATLEALGDKGSVILKAGKDLILDTDRLQAKKDMTENRDNYIRTYRKTETSDTLAAGKDITLAAGDHVSIRNAVIASKNGAVTAAAKGDVTVTNGYNEARDDYGLKYKEKGLLSSKTTAIRSHDEEKKASPTIISGDTVSILSGKDTRISGSQVIAAQDVTAVAGGDVHISSAPEYEAHDYEKQVQKGGILSGGGLGFTIGREKRKDRYDSTGLTERGSTLGSAGGNVLLTSGKDLTVEASTLAAGKNIDFTGKNVTIISRDNVYTNKEEHEYKRSGISLSLGGNLINTVNSIAAPLSRAGEVKDRRLTALYGLEAGKNLKEAVSGYVGNVKTIEDMEKDMSRTEKLRQTVIADGIATPMTENNLETIQETESKILDKAKANNKDRRSMALDVSLGTAKARSISENRIVRGGGSTLHAEDTLIVNAEKDMAVKGSQVSAKDVYLKAGKDIRILSTENRSTGKEKESSSAASLGGSIGGTGFTSIRASYGKGRGDGKNEEITHTQSIITAEHTLSLESGRDTTLKGGRAEGEKVKTDVGGSLILESEQDRKNYQENGKTIGMSLGYAPSGNVSGYASAGKSRIDSGYESVTNQAGIYAGKEGFEISVKDNTHLKGAVIDSKGSADKNSLRTGILRWEDVENKAGYRLSGRGIVINKTSYAPYNERGVIPDIPIGSRDKVYSNTRASIAQGTIIIHDRESQKQDIATTLNRNTRDSLNKLEKIFNKTKVEERQELASLFGKLAFNYIHGVNLTPNQRAAWHALIGGIMGQISNKEFIAGAIPAGINETMIVEIQKVTQGDPELMQWIGICIGSITGQLISRLPQLGGSVTANGVKNNDVLMTPEEIVDIMLDNGRNENYQLLGTLENNKEQLLKFVNKYQEADAIMVVGSMTIGLNGTPVQASGEMGIVYDLQDNDFYTTYGSSFSTDGSKFESTGSGITFVAVRIICDDSSVDLNAPAIRHSILSGASASIQGYYGIGGGLSIPVDPQYADKIRLVIIGIGTPQIGGDTSYSSSIDDLLKNQYEQRKTEYEENKYGSD